MYERKKKYTTVSISEELMTDIKKHIRTYDYVSVADFIRLAVREKINLDETSETGGHILHTPNLKPTLENIQKDILEIKKEMQKDKEKKKRRW